MKEHWLDRYLVYVKRFKVLRDRLAPHNAPEELAGFDASVTRNLRALLSQAPDEDAKHKDRFTFCAGQVFYDGLELDLPTGFTIDVLKTLVESFGVCVPFQSLDSESLEKEAPDRLRKANRQINRQLNAKNIRLQIINKRGEGYFLRRSR